MRTVTHMGRHISEYDTTDDVERQTKADMTTSASKHTRHTTATTNWIVPNIFPIFSYFCHSARRFSVGTSGCYTLFVVLSTPSGHTTKEFPTSGLKRP